jgi:hypothetical protein
VLKLSRKADECKPLMVGLALCSLGNLCTAEMARDVAPEVSKLLGRAIPTTTSSAEVRDFCNALAHSVCQSASKCYEQSNAKHGQITGLDQNRSEPVIGACVALLCFALLCS